MGQILEWFQCKACGRRHRWRADVAGTEIVCPCGKMVTVPELQAYDQAGASAGPGDTRLGSSSSGSRSPVLDARAMEQVPSDDLELQIEGAAPARAVRGTRVGGIIAMGPTSGFLFWLLMGATGFTAIVFAAIVVEWYYIVLAVIWGPFSFWQLRKALRRWQGNRSFARAVQETIGD